ncbi:MAG: hypothetical protein ACJ70V_04465, partial [Nitrososphaera sp.]
MRSEKRDADCSPLVENGSLPVENGAMHIDGDNDSEETLSIPQATTTKASKIDEDGFRKYLLAQG